MERKRNETPILTGETFLKFIIPLIFIVWNTNVLAFDIEGIKYSILSESEGTVCVVSQTATDQLVGEIQIPDTVNYEGKDYTVTEISGWAFYLCDQLTTVHLPQSLQSIGVGAFCQCSNLKTIDIPDGVASLGSSAFYECGQLTSVRLSDNITEIGDWTFTRCYNLKDINFPKTLQRIGEYAFYYCSIEELSIPRTLTEIGRSAFGGCKKIRTITVEDGNPQYLCDDGVLFNQDKTNLVLFPPQSDRTNYDIPTTVTTITPGAFNGSKLKSITLPPTLTIIGNSWLSGCTQLESISIPASVTSIESAAFNGCSSLTELYVPNTVQSIGISAFSGCKSLVKVHLPESLVRIEGWTFDGCSSLNEIVVPESVNYIGMAAFLNCSRLTVFQFPQGVTIIDDYAFEGCQSLKELVIPEKVENVGWDAFLNCSELEKVTIGSSVKALEGGTFYGCDNIVEVWSYVEEPFDVIDYEDSHGGIVLLGRCFPEAVTNNAILHVPEGTTEKYLSKRGWRDFHNLVEMNVEAVSSPSVDEHDHALYYDLSGQRLNGKPVRGIYIQNGKKVLVK